MLSVIILDPDDLLHFSPYSFCVASLRSCDLRCFHTILCASEDLTKPLQLPHSSSPLLHCQSHMHTHTVVGSQCVSDPDIWHLSHQGAISFFPLIFLIKQRGRWGEGKKREAEGQQKRKRRIGRNDDPPKKKRKAK